MALTEEPEPDAFWCAGCKPDPSLGTWVSFLPIRHPSRHYLLTDALNSANQLHMTSAYYDITFENEFLMLI